MKKIISIIIPVYNNEAYIEECLSSIVSSKVEKEVIVINDGSTDRTEEIISKYKVRKEFKIISTANLGVSHARNIGLKNAVGDYVLFLDSDDQLTKNGLEKFIYTISKYSGDLYYGWKSDRNSKCFPINNNEIIEMILFNKIPRTACGIVFKRELINKNNLSFDENLVYGEDFLFTIEYLKKCSTSVVLNENLYLVTPRLNSISRRNDFNHFDKVFAMEEKMNLIFKENEFFRGKAFTLQQEIILAVEKVVKSNLSITSKLKIINKIKKNNLLKTCFRMKVPSGFKHALKKQLIHKAPGPLILLSYAILLRRR
ncbi:glycosyltransferase family 2 protein [Bhargavaea beijingensis]|uniref:glycosyltransferase family 2 protein n=1 Tax=Bhargavaea beijingensis TaxID=426756 RepID=UPI002225AEBC|nr:glycosyltransferase family A protein [Bhargavaea beijingensis]MCW1929093.1 glycosyltransferase family 2 protein [Bhargavaea beijingensis]